MDVETSTRVVFVLGRRTRLGAPEIEAAAADASEVVVLSLGYPVSRAQRRAVDAALALAARLDVRMDAILVVTTAELADAISQSDKVIVTGSRGERRRLHSHLARS
ncbi:MAG TPA: hypothetical protein VFT27_02190 [Actinomycetota bacterium]|nr:hypothetical protein [Actinomycetota bacterium]